MNKKMLEELGFGKEINRIEEGKCPMCGKEIDMDDFRDEESRREYEISGLCQSCQDKFFD